MAVFSGVHDHRGRLRRAVADTTTIEALGELPDEPATTRVSLFCVGGNRSHRRTNPRTERGAGKSD